MSDTALIRETAAQPFDKTTPVLPGEVWKAHPTWPLDVSSMGRVRSKKTQAIVGSFGSRTGKGRAPRDGYIQVSVIRADGTRGTEKVHTLVLETFIGPRPGRDWDGDHVDHDHLNNEVDNLRWRLAKHNRADAIRHTRGTPSATRRTPNRPTRSTES